MRVIAEILVGLLLAFGAGMTIWFLWGYDGSGPW